MSDSSTLTRRATVGAAAVGALALAASSVAQADDSSIAPLLKVLRAHDYAYMQHDVKGVLATMTENVFLLGSGTAEIWKGRKEVATAYEHFFKDFDKGPETFEAIFHEGAISGNIGYFTAALRVNTMKGSKKKQFPLNLSVAFAKVKESWFITGLHYSTSSSGKPGA